MECLSLRSLPAAGTLLKSLNHRLCLSLLLALFLGACGGGGDGTDSRPGALSLAGTVEDGPIAGAIVRIVDTDTDEVSRLCGPSGTGRCETKTGPHGAFSFEMAEGASLEPLEVVATGGLDTETGADFTGIALRSSLAHFAGLEESITVTPATSLLAASLHSGESPAEAEQRIRSWLGLKAGMALGASPSSDPELLKRSLLLSRLALELRQVGIADPLAHLARQAGEEPLVTGTGSLDPGLLADLGLDDAQIHSAQKLYSALCGGSQLSPATIFKQASIASGFADALGSLLEAGPGSSLSEETRLAVDEKSDLIADMVLTAAAEKTIPLDGVALQRITRYVLFSYGLSSLEWLEAEPADFSALLVKEENGLPVPLEADPQIASLAETDTLYSSAEPLLLHEIPGDDNAKRLAYYYGSDLSHLYRAEQLTAMVFDDAANDPIMREVAGGKAQAGLLDEAASLIATQIYQSQVRADAYRDLAKSLRDFGRPMEAVEALDLAFALYLDIIEAKGKASVGKDDILNLQFLGADFRRAGALERTEEVLKYIESLVPYLGTYTTYSRLLTGTLKVLDAHLEDGDLAGAMPLLDSLYAYALETPPNESKGKSYYGLKTFYLLETAERFADLGESEVALEICDQLIAIREDDGLEGLTLDATWVYVPALVELLYRAGEAERAFALAETIPDTYVNQFGSTRNGTSYQTKAYKLVATYEALISGFDAALVIVNERLPADTDKIEALTYFAVNKGAEYIALAYILDGEFALAKRALDAATQLLATLEPSSDKDRYVQLIQQGYAKVADLYGEIGESDIAAELLARGEAVLGEMAEPEYLVKGSADLALVYDLLGHYSTAAGLMEGAFVAAESFGLGASAEDGAELFEVLARAYLEMEDFTGAEAAIERFADRSMAIFDEGTDYTGDDHDDLAEDEVDNLLDAARYMVQAGNRAGALAIVDAARDTADQIFVEATRIEKYVDDKKDHIVGGYADAGDMERALDLANAIPYAEDRYLAIQAIAEAFAQQDAFADTWVANVDTDGDGRPDFFNPLASEEDILASGLELDEDSDGDGISDAEDLRPLFAD
ncbi:MAG: hypothetical protein C0617_05080 [Desulfuromonas sp.]|uniref:hypothetical protein n=1 Tax=Desulfuromonas sp. TaxID=892 RepID=UPI000CB4B141|nr:hypothetical protein [Desulfuromonas sp.]PLX85067.1 MAG: hypothetical protein C0617_05080 [Desulfuromonas sp.]